MGNSTSRGFSADSFASLSSKDIANLVCNFGSAYSYIGSILIENGVDGTLIMRIRTSIHATELLRAIGIENELHIFKILSELSIFRVNAEQASKKCSSENSNDESASRSEDSNDECAEDSEFVYADSRVAPEGVGQAIMTAVNEKDIEKLQSLVEKWRGNEVLDWRDPCYRDSTPLIVASSICDDTEIIRLLLHHGANVNLLDCFGMTALHHAVCSDSLEILRVLLDNGADVDLVPLNESSLNRDRYGYATPFTSLQNAVILRQ